MRGWYGLLLLGVFASPFVGGSGFPRFESIRDQTQDSELTIWDRHHYELHQLRADSQKRRLSWTPLNRISPSLRAAVIQSEDHRFWAHAGVDWKALGYSALRMLGSRSRRGGSTISMQVASMIFEWKKPRHRSWVEKWNQIQWARDLEKNWTKDQILEVYLNRVSFRGELQGIAAASETFFGKQPHGLSLDESLALAVLIRSPQAEVVTVNRRACQLGQSFQKGYRCSEVKLLTQPRPAGARLAPHLAHRFSGRKEVVSTVDRDLQVFVAEALHKQVAVIGSHHVQDAAVLVVDNATGEILAYVGGSGAYSQASEVDMIQAHRQAGSTLKPFIYLAAIEGRFITPATVLEDAPTEISVGNGVYRPRNYDHEFHGDVTARLALASSLNVPAVRVLQYVGVARVVRALKALGFEDLESPEFYGPSLALGSADITLLQLVNAYRSLANGGLWSPLRWEMGTPQASARRIFSQDSAYLISDILSDRESRHLTFGLENPMGLRFWTAAKTGTSKDMRDNWCVGFSRRYTVGVWNGNASGEPMWNVSGSTGAAPLWNEVMTALHRHEASTKPLAPNGVVQVAGEFYLRGTEPDFRETGLGLNGAVSERRATKMALPPSPKTRISSPTNGVIIALDPDIPAELQRVELRSSGRSDGLQWRVNGEAAPGGWYPKKAGEYQIELLDPAGMKLDSVAVSVRGGL